MVEKSPTFQYWDTVLNMELEGLVFIRSRRDKSFPLYVESIDPMVFRFGPPQLRKVAPNTH